MLEGSKSHAPEVSRLRRQKNKENGLCQYGQGYCLNRVVPGTSQCQKHLTRERTLVKRYIVKHFMQRLCYACPNPVIPGHVYCEYHRRYHEKKNHLRKTILGKDPSRCGGCGRKMDPEQDAGFITCYLCRYRKQTKGGMPISNEILDRIRAKDIRVDPVRRQPGGQLFSVSEGLPGDDSLCVAGQESDCTSYGG